MEELHYENILSCQTKTDKLELANAKLEEKQNWKLKVEAGTTMKVRTVLPWLNITKFENGKMKSKSRLVAGSFQETSSYKFTQIHLTKI